MKQILLPTHELLTFAVFIVVVINLWTARGNCRNAFGTVSGARATTIAALILVGVGEALNALVFHATVYSGVFLIWIPLSGVPLFILCEGVVVALILYAGTNRLAMKLRASKLSAKITLCALASLASPLLERLGVALGFWNWSEGVSFDLGWHVGVWQFYFLFVAVPAIIGLGVDHLEKHSSRD